MTPRTRKLYSVWLDPEHLEGLKALKARDGAPESESVRRALSAYLQEKGVTKKTERKRAVTRKRP
jgi:predicted DNA-binding protein